jgi:hypothetical protein
MNIVSDRGVWIESEVPLAETTQWFAPLRLIKSVSQGKTAILGSISPLLAGNLDTIRDIYAAWINGKKVPLEFESAPKEPAVSNDVSLFFSGGVDSFHSLIKHKSEVKNLILVHGFDIPLVEEKAFSIAESQARYAAQLFDKRLIVVRTNLHFEQPAIPCNWGMYHGAALAAVAHALSPNHGKIYIASSYSYADLHSWGSHPLLDPLWSSETLQIIHDGGETRMDKLRLLVQYPEALTRLRVCWENLGDYNCGHCEKCIRTMLGLRALGVDRCAAFPDTLTPKLVRQQGLSHDSALFWRELLGAGLAPAFHRAVQSAIHSYEGGLPPNIGTWKRDAKRWLCAAQNAKKALMAPFY